MLVKIREKCNVLHPNKSKANNFTNISQRYNRIDKDVVTALIPDINIIIHNLFAISQDLPNHIQYNIVATSIRDLLLYRLLYARRSL